MNSATHDRPWSHPQAARCSQPDDPAQPCLRDQRGRRPASRRPGPLLPVLLAALVLASLAGCATPAAAPTGNAEAGASNLPDSARRALPPAWQSRWPEPATRSSAPSQTPGVGTSPPPTDAPQLAHGADPRALADWWARLGDPVLVSLIRSAQTVSPSISAAQARLIQARSAVTLASASLLPRVDASASVARGRQQLGGQTGWLAQAGPTASWEWDLFGGNRAGQEAAQARARSAQDLWHDARVSVAAETAFTYVQLRACEAQREQTALDARSREETARLTALSERAGFQAPSFAALANASAAQGRALLTSQQAACDSLVKALVALTGEGEPALRAQLAPGTSRVPEAQAHAGHNWDVPAVALMQRPDLRAAAEDWQAAVADLKQARAAERPRVSLSGSFSAQRVSSGSVSANGNTWSIGPISVTLPLFDAGARRAESTAADARRQDAEQQLQARIRQAVREVEDALVQLDSADRRAADARAAAAGFEASFRAAEARQRGGLASLFELEDARRTAVAANAALIDLQRDRTSGWINLYRAVGGAWTLAESAPAAAPPRP